MKDTVKRKVYFAKITKKEQIQMNEDEYNDGLYTGI